MKNKLKYFKFLNILLFYKILNNSFYKLFLKTILKNIFNQS